MEQENEVAVVEERKSTKGMERRINVRLSEDMIAAIDSAVENGLATSRSDGIRKIITTFQNIGGPNKGITMSFIAHIVSEPLEFFIWLKDRVNLLNHDDDWRRREAGLMTLFMKAAAIKGEILDKIDLPEIRQRLFSTMSSFDGFDAFESLPEHVIPAPPAEGGSVAPGFAVFRSDLSETIKSAVEVHEGVTKTDELISRAGKAREVAEKLAALIVLAGTYDSCEADGVDPTLSGMADAAHVQDVRPAENSDMDVGAFDDMFENFCLLEPLLFDNDWLRDSVRVWLYQYLFRIPLVPWTERQLLESGNPELSAFAKSYEEDAEQHEG